MSKWFWKCWVFHCTKTFPKGFPCSGTGNVWNDNSITYNLLYLLIFPLAYIFKHKILMTPTHNMLQSKSVNQWHVLSSWKITAGMIVWDVVAVAVVVVVEVVAVVVVVNLCQQYVDPETGAAKLNSAIINYYLYLRFSHCQDVCCGASLGQPTHQRRDFHLLLKKNGSKRI